MVLINSDRYDDDGGKCDVDMILFKSFHGMSTKNDWLGQEGFLIKMASDLQV